jgi:hypothetical protein
MKLDLRVGTNRAMVRKAKIHFADTYRVSYNSITIENENKKRFFDDFGKENNMKVIITEFRHGFPVIDEIEFNSDKDLTWFILRWS